MRHRTSDRRARQEKRLLVRGPKDRGGEKRDAIRWKRTRACVYVCLWEWGGSSEPNRSRSAMHSGVRGRYAVTCKPPCPRERGREGHAGRKREPLPNLQSPARSAFRRGRDAPTHRRTDAPLRWPMSAGRSSLSSAATFAPGRCGLPTQFWALCHSGASDL